MARAQICALALALALATACAGSSTRQLVGYTRVATESRLGAAQRALVVEMTNDVATDEALAARGRFDELDGLGGGDVEMLLVSSMRWLDALHASGELASMRGRCVSSASAHKQTQDFVQDTARSNSTDDAISDLARSRLCFLPARGLSARRRRGR